MTEITPVLEPAAQEFADATANPPQLYDLPVAEGRKMVDSVQDGDIQAPPVDITDLMISGGPSGQVSIKIFRPRGVYGSLQALLFTHGAGWVFGDAHTHGRLVAELATRSGAAAVFTNYSLSPEARYPTALEEIYAVLEWIGAHGAEQQLDPARIAVAGDSVGGNMTTAITIMAKQRGGPTIAAQLLYYPVTNANFDTGSYRQFATHYWLSRTGHAVVLGPVHHRPGGPRADHRVAAARQPGGPGRAAAGAGHRRRGRSAAGRGRGLRGQAPAAGVPVTAVRYGGIIHDFVMVNALRDTHAARAATAQGGEFLRAALHDK